MKHACPSCHGAGISGFAKRWSARECPATCELCGGLSHVIASTSSGIFVGSILVFVVAMIALTMQSDGFWLGAVVAACLSGAFNVWAWRRVQMFPIPKENAQAAANVGWLVASVES